MCLLFSALLIADLLSKNAGTAKPARAPLLRNFLLFMILDSGVNFLRVLLKITTKMTEFNCRVTAVKKVISSKPQPMPFELEASGADYLIFLALRLLMKLK